MPSLAIAVLPLHGSLGYLDELLVCGAGVAVLLIAVLVAGVRQTAREDPPLPEADTKHGPSR